MLAAWIRFYFPPLNASTFSTSSLLPIINGVRWCIALGTFSKIRLRSVRRQSSRLLREKRQRVRFIKQTQLALGRFLRLRIQKHPAADQRPVKIRHQRPDVTRAVTARFIGLRPIQVFLDVVGKFAAVPAVHAVSLARSPASAHFPAPARTPRWTGPA